MSRVVQVWDLPVRLFHWLLVVLVVISFTTGKLGGNWLAWHFRSGYCILALVLFRIVWGLFGSQTARFTVTATDAQQRKVKLSASALPTGASFIDLGNNQGTFTWTPTSTQTGTFVAVPLHAGRPTFTGHFTQWDGFNSNRQSATGTFTFSIHGTGSDGSSVKFHEVAHVTMTKTGVIVRFDKAKCA